LTVVLRAASRGDAKPLAKLLGELGYPTDSKAIPARLRLLDGHAGAMAYVAELNGAVVGVVTVHVFPVVHSTPPAAWLTALVVDEKARGKGVGQKLVAHAERWAAEHGATKISLTSALRREQAHAFYKALGYEHTGVRLTKALAAK
jgi:GNAT superfamily N-acetyltransferase